MYNPISDLIARVRLWRMLRRERVYEPLELQNGLYEALAKTWGDYLKENVADGAVVCNESDGCYGCLWDHEVECQLEHFELVIMR